MDDLVSIVACVVAGLHRLLPIFAWWRWWWLSGLRLRLDRGVVVPLCVVDRRPRGDPI